MDVYKVLKCFKKINNMCEDVEDICFILNTKSDTVYLFCYYMSESVDGLFFTFLDESGFDKLIYVDKGEIESVRVAYHDDMGFLEDLDGGNDVEMYN